MASPYVLAQKWGEQEYLKNKKISTYSATIYKKIKILKASHLIATKQGNHYRNPNKHHSLPSPTIVGVTTPSA